VVVPAPTPGPTPQSTPDPAPSSAGVPLSFSDPVYASVTSGTSGFALPPDSSRADLSIMRTRGIRRLPAKGSCSLTRVRIQSREGVAASAAISI